MILRACRSRFPVFTSFDNKGPGRENRAAIMQRVSAPRRLSYSRLMKLNVAQLVVELLPDVPPNCLSIWLASPGGGEYSLNGTTRNVL
jgi:hypothetical protein